MPPLRGMRMGDMGAGGLGRSPGAMIKPSRPVMRPSPNPVVDGVDPLAPLPTPSPDEEWQAMTAQPELRMEPSFSPEQLALPTVEASTQSGGGRGIPWWLDQLVLGGLGGAMLKANNGSGPVTPLAAPVPAPAPAPLPPEQPGQGAPPIAAVPPEVAQPLFKRRARQFGPQRGMIGPR